MQINVNTGKIVWNTWLFVCAHLHKIDTQIFQFSILRISACIKRCFCIPTMLYVRATFYAAQYNKNKFHSFFRMKYSKSINQDDFNPFFRSAESFMINCSSALLVVCSNTLCEVCISSAYVFVFQSKSHDFDAGND